jgi:hypothetical protein
MRRVGAAFVAAFVVLGLAGCSAGATSATVSPRESEFVVLGSATTTADPTASAMPGLAANSVPKQAFKGISGAERIVVASGTPVVSRNQAIEAARLADGKLVSAVDVLLPAEVMGAILASAKTAKPTTAWAVTWTGVTQHVPARGKSASKRAIRHGNTTVVVDASTGKVLTRIEYATR